MKKLNKVVALLAVFGSLTAFAAPATAPVRSTSGTLWELGATAGSFNFTTFSPLTWQINVSGDVGYQFLAGIQAVLMPQIQVTPTSGLYGTNVGIRLNHSFSENIKDDFFLFLGAFLGVTSVQTFPTITNTAFSAKFVAHLGKRFMITESVAYRPFVGVGVGSAVNLDIVPLSFSFFF